MNELDQISLARARRGDPVALTALVACYGARVHALVARMMVGQPSDQIDDLCQDTLVKVIGALPRFDPGGTARLSSWILTITARTCIDQLRRRQELATLPEEALDSGSESPEGAAQRHELTQRVERAMVALTADQRAVLVLRAYHDFDYDEIAVALKIAPGTVKSRLNRARQALRTAVGERAIKG
jgi:RNA polymerase sigma-70 factor, ECF subfamily